MRAIIYFDGNTVEYRKNTITGSIKVFYNGREITENEFIDHDPMKELKDALSFKDNIRFRVEENGKEVIYEINDQWKFGIIMGKQLVTVFRNGNQIFQQKF